MATDNTDTGVREVLSPDFIGIDLGTTNSSVAIYRQGQIQVIPMHNECLTMPSAVRFKNRKKNDLVVGKLAKDYILIKPDEVFTSVKSLMSDNEWKDKSEIRNKFNIDGEQFTPTDIAAIILQELVTNANRSVFGTDLNYGANGSFVRAIITVPANSSPIYKQHVMEAAEKAGLGETDEFGNVKHNANGHVAGVYILEEPTAAALAYASMRFDETKDKEQNILVYDFGGGTFDATVLKLKSEVGKRPQFTRLSTYGIADLGGDTIDWVLAKMIAKHIQNETNIDVLCNPSSIEAKSRIKELAENAKIQFSVSNETDIEIELASVILDSNNAEKRASNIIISRESFISEITPLLEKTIECIKTVLKAASMTADDINRIVLVGGSSKAPWVKKIIKEKFDRDPYMADNVDTIVAQGAAYYGFMGPDITPAATSHNYGVEVQGGLFSPLVLKDIKFEENEFISYEATFYNSNDSGRATISGFITQNEVPYTQNEKGTRTSEFLVMQNNQIGEPMFKHIGEFDITIPRKPQGEVEIVLIMKVFKDNHIEIIAKADGKETPSIWKYE